MHFLLHKTFYFFSRLSKEQLNPHLKNYVEMYGIKDYHGNQSIEVEHHDVLHHNIESITFYDDSSISGSVVVSSI